MNDLRLGHFQSTLNGASQSFSWILSYAFLFMLFLLHICQPQCKLNQFYGFLSMMDTLMANSEVTKDHSKVDFKSKFDVYCIQQPLYSFSFSFISSRISDFWLSNNQLDTLDTVVNRPSCVPWRWAVLPGSVGVASIFRLPSIKDFTISSVTFALRCLTKKGEKQKEEHCQQSQIHSRRRIEFVLCLENRLTHLLEASHDLLQDFNTFGLHFSTSQFPGSIAL